MRVLSALWLSLCFTGCAVSPAQQAAMEVEYHAQLARQPIAYQFGYEDGCRIGTQKILGGTDYMPIKDQERFTSDAEYAKGWSVGFNRCYFINGGI